MEIRNKFESNLDDYFISPEIKDIDNTKFEIRLNCIYYFFFCLLEIFLVLLLIQEFYFLLKRFSKELLILTLFQFIFILILCFNNPIKKKIILIKNDNGELILRTIGFMNCCKGKDITLYTENIHYNVLSPETGGIGKSDFECCCDTYLLIMNHFKNNKEIDLDLSDIKNTPVKTFYYFRIGCCYDINELQNKLNKFSNLSNYCYGFLYKIKFSEYFYTYYFFNPVNRYCTILIVFFFFYNFFMLIIYAFLSTGFKRPLIIFLPTYFIILIIILICYCFLRERRLRIDFIYSNNFDRIFIGIVKYNGKSYLNTFMFDINSIQKCVFEKQKKGYILKIIFNDGMNFQDITKFNKDRRELEGIISFLNFKLNNKKSKNPINLLYDTPSNN